MPVPIRIPVPVLDFPATDFWKTESVRVVSRDEGRKNRETGLVSSQDFQFSSPYFFLDTDGPEGCCRNSWRDSASWIYSIRDPEPAQTPSDTEIHTYILSQKAMDRLEGDTEASRPPSLPARGRGRRRHSSPEDRPQYAHHSTSGTTEPGDETSHCRGW